MRILCVLAQRNETACLRPWMRYHTYMAGAENIHIIDNASTIPSVLAELDDYESMGIKVTRLPPGKDLHERGQYTSDIIRSIEATNEYDFVFPMDCDEFLCSYRENGEPSCDRGHLLTYLKQLSSQRGVFQIKDGLENVHKGTGSYVRRSFWTKAFFTGGQCLNMDIGFHRGYPRNGAEPVVSNVFYVHYQVRPYKMFRHLARQKLEFFVNPDDPVALAAHTGANVHLVRLFRLNEAEYDAELLRQRQAESDQEIAFPEFVSLLRQIGIDPNFLENEYRSGGVYGYGSEASPRV